MQTRSKTPVQSDANNNFDKEYSFEEENPGNEIMKNDRPSLMQILIGIISFSTLWYTISSTKTLITFLSANEFGVLGSSTENESSKCLAWDSLLLIFFCVSHSLLASSTVKAYWDEYLPAPLQRNAYLIVTGCTLQYLASHWQTTSHYIWDISNIPFISQVFLIFHICAWLYIIGAIYLMDYAEFLGIKYTLNSESSCPFSNRTVNARRYLTHSRHGTVVGFLAVFWFVPIMTIDRLLLATVLSAYIFERFQVDDSDYRYAKRMYVKKHLHVN